MISGFQRCRGTVCLEVKPGMILRVNVARKGSQDRDQSMCACSSALIENTAKKAVGISRSSYYGYIEDYPTNGVKAECYPKVDEEPVQESEAAELYHAFRGSRWIHSFFEARSEPKRESQEGCLDKAEWLRE